MQSASYSFNLAVDSGFENWTPTPYKWGETTLVSQSWGGLSQIISWFTQILYGRQPDVHQTVEMTARPLDGLGNNEVHTDWGATGTALLRLAPDTRGPNEEMSDRDLPNAREISNVIAQQDGDTVNQAGASDFLWIWGQFIDHDMSLTEAGNTVTAHIEVPAGDPYFDPTGTGNAVIPFTRVDSHDGDYVNEITAYLDASMIYGSDSDTVEKMRVAGGKLAMTEDSQLALEGANLVTGDVRAAENIALSSMHTIFTREHNRIVEEMAAENRALTSDELFEGARARVEAIVQAITFNDFLPILVGEDAIDTYSGYDETVNAGVSVEFSTAVYRLGHTLLSSNLQMVGEDGTIDNPLALRDAFFRPSLLQEPDMIDDLLRGAATQTSQALDTMVVEDVRSFLFGAPGAGGFDLAALNIQRGRDLGVASYNDLRAALGLERAATFGDITSDSDLAARLHSVYGDVDLVDAWVGGLAEDPMNDGLLGELFTIITVDQFTRLRDGDAYWSESREGFTDQERTELWDTSLSDVILRNTDIEAIQTDVFKAMTRTMGTDHRDVLIGDEGSNFLYGGGGHDDLHGCDGDDDLQGGAGRDKLSGGQGDDILTGGAGKDRFVFDSRQSGDDIITDFDLYQDSLVLNNVSRWDVCYKERGDDVFLALDNDSSITIEGMADDVNIFTWWHLLT